MRKKGYLNTIGFTEALDQLHGKALAGLGHFFASSSASFSKPPCFFTVVIFLSWGVFNIGPRFHWANSDQFVGSKLSKLNIFPIKRFVCLTCSFLSVVCF